MLPTCRYDTPKKKRDMVDIGTICSLHKKLKKKKKKNISFKIDILFGFLYAVRGLVGLKW